MPVAPLSANGAVLPPYPAPYPSPVTGPVPPAGFPPPNDAEQRQVVSSLFASESAMPPPYPAASSMAPTVFPPNDAEQRQMVSQLFMANPALPPPYPHGVPPPGFGVFPPSPFVAFASPPIEAPLSLAASPSQGSSSIVWIVLPPQQ